MRRDVDGPALAMSVGRVRSPPLPPDNPPNPPSAFRRIRYRSKSGGIRGGSLRGPADGPRAVAVGGPGAVRAPCPRPRLRGVRWPALDMSGFRRGSARGLSESASVGCGLCRQCLLPPRVGLPARPRPSGAPAPSGARPASWVPRGRGAGRLVAPRRGGVPPRPSCGARRRCPRPFGASGVGGPLGGWASRPCGAGCVGGPAGVGLRAALIPRPRPRSISPARGPSDDQLRA